MEILAWLIAIYIVVWVTVWGLALRKVISNATAVMILLLINIAMYIYGFIKH